MSIKGSFVDIDTPDRKQVTNTTAEDKCLKEENSFTYTCKYTSIITEIRDSFLKLIL